MARAPGPSFVVGENHPPAAGGNHLVSIKAQAGERPDAPDIFPDTIPVSRTKAVSFKNWFEPEKGQD